jgi:hypothetical protein
VKLTGIKVKNVKLAKRVDGRDAVVHDEAQVLARLPVNKRIIRKNSKRMKWKPAKWPSI